MLYSASVSATRCPTQVFMLLEAIYCALDDLAHSYGIYKVEVSNVEGELRGKEPFFFFLHTCPIIDGG